MTALPELTVLHEDNHLLAVLKPAGMPVQGDESGDESLLDRTREWIRIKYQKPGNVYCGLVHRLDRPTSGVIVFAKTSKAASRLSDQFRSRRIQKIYRAVVRPAPRIQSDTLTHFLEKEEGRRVSRVHTVSRKGTQKATLHYHTLSRHQGMAELEVILETGRKHQIRAQLSHIGSPILGDLKYGAATPLAGGRAIALHAFALTLTHPTRKDEITIEAPLPPYWPQ
ncbi:MAG: RluA family pseudouridine synthase [Planctomycetota bacterium]|jgi:23S rRNA pseudouridine1911/1915/1917 synthase